MGFSFYIDLVMHYGGTLNSTVEQQIEWNFVSPPNMIAIRSFDVNKPGFQGDGIRGGVAGGSILRRLLGLRMKGSERQCKGVKAGQGRNRDA
ncbi:hypothetical protein CDL15_Pgr011347 [Punica granatum]|uniref:Uncharacterized protein n=1 Tax=Punica granatum TaxID=22663 RepID=A0A218WFT9_PUNGR|nr:hypothetical protein CDL15_Pgr011347 [Punica granatum]